MPDLRLSGAVARQGPSTMAPPCPYERAFFPERKQRHPIIRRANPDPLPPPPHLLLLLLARSPNTRRTLRSETAHPPTCCCSLLLLGLSGAGTSLVEPDVHTKPCVVLLPSSSSSSLSVHFLLLLFAEWRESCRSLRCCFELWLFIDL